jgi:hypothetical protein
MRVGVLEEQDDTVSIDAVFTLIHFDKNYTALQLTQLFLRQIPSKLE